MSGVPRPKFVLKGHRASVHAATFIRHNTRLVTGDADGFVALWHLVTKRVTGVWRAHDKAILGLKGWGDKKLITHGRDNKLIVWQLAESDEEGLSSVMPLDQPHTDRRPPWILHLLEVNTMNFCSFSACPRQRTRYARFLDDHAEILVAVPNTVASEAVDVFALPSQKRLQTVHPGSSNGMAMSLSLFHLHGLTLIGGFENGHASVHRMGPSGQWTTVYRTQVHSQPILSLDVRPDLTCFFTSGADALLVKHPIPPDPQDISKLSAQAALNKSSQGAAVGATVGGEEASAECQGPRKVVHTKHAGQQSLEVRSDGGIFATAGWDTKIRVYSCKSMKELAVLKWHQDGVSAVTFSDMELSKVQADGGDGKGEEVKEGEEGGESRADAACAGGAHPSRHATTDGVDAAKCATHAANSTNGVVVARAGDVSRMTVTERRLHRVKMAHWVAAGAKDGRVSLWDIY